MLKDRHVEHLAKAERMRDIPPRTFEQYATVARMSDEAATRLSGDTVPAVLLGVIGAPEFDRNEEDGVDATYQVGMQVTVMGQKRSDTLFRRDVMAWTTIECLLQRTPRGAGSLINSIRLTDYEPLADADTQRTLGDARVLFEVGVANVLTITGGLPASDSDWPPEAGGPPEEPYDDPAPKPQVTELTYDLDKLPIVE